MHSPTIMYFTPNLVPTCFGSTAIIREPAHILLKLTTLTESYNAFTYQGTRCNSWENFYLQIYQHDQPRGLVVRVSDY
jgi:hypothetical protein